MPPGFSIPGTAYDPITGEPLTPEEQAVRARQDGFNAYTFPDPAELGQGQGFGIVTTAPPNAGRPIQPGQGGVTAGDVFNRVDRFASDAFSYLNPENVLNSLGNTAGSAYRFATQGSQAARDYRRDNPDTGGIGTQAGQAVESIPVVGPYARRAAQIAIAPGGAELGLANTALSAIGGVGARQLAEQAGLGETGQGIADLAGSLIVPVAAKPAARAARAINAAGDRAALAETAGAGEYGRGKYQDVAFPRVRIAGGAEFTPDELAAQQMHIQRSITEDPNLTSAIGKIQDSLAIEERLRARGGIAEQELSAGRARQAGRVLNAQEAAAQGGMTLDQAATAAAEESRTGKFRQTFAPGADLTDAESVAIARLLANSPALEGKTLTYRNYVGALRDFLKGGDIQPEQRKRLGDLLGISLEKPTAPARGANGERFPAGPNQYPARITGEQQAPVTQTYRNAPQQEIAGRARILGGDGQMKEGVIQPSLFEPDTYMVVDPKTGQPIPDFLPDGTPIPGSEIRRVVTASRNPEGPTQFPSAVGMESAPQQAGLGIEAPPLEGFSGAPENARSLTPAGLAEAAMRGREGPEFAQNAQRSRANFNPQAPEGMAAAGQQPNLIQPSALEGAAPLARVSGETDVQYAARIARAQARAAAENRMGAGGIGEGQDIATRRPTVNGATTPEPQGARGRQAALPEEFLPRNASGRTRPKPEVGSVWQNVKDLISARRIIGAGGEMSPLTRQGRRVMLAYNKQWRGAVKDSLRALRNDEKAWEVSDRIDASRNRGLYDKLKIDLPNPDNYDMAVQEENFLHGNTIVARAVEKVPLIRRTERATAVFMKSVRSGLADYFIDKIGRDNIMAMPDEHAQSIGKLINAMTGRGYLPEELQAHAQTLNQVFFSPRNQIANVQVPATVFFGRNTDQIGRTVVGIPRLRYEAAKALVADSGSKWAIRFALASAGAKVGFDINSSDWGKIILPNGMRIDMDGGDSQMERLIANMMSGSVTNTAGVTSQKNRFAIAANYIAGKFAPWPSDAFRTYFPYGIGESMGSPNFSPENVAQELLISATNMWLQDVESAVRDTYVQGYSPSAALASGGLAALAGTTGFASTNMNSADTQRAVIANGGYQTSSPEDQAKSFGILTWDKASKAPNVPQEYRDEISQYASHKAWADAATETYKQRYIDAFKQRGETLEPGLAQVYAERALQQNPIQKLYSGARNVYEREWVVANPQLAIKFMNEDAKLPKDERRLSLNLEEVAFLVRQSRQN